MALKSRLFRGDSKLEAAAVSHPAHILQGAKGPHVRKIQMALIRLDRAKIESGELRGSTYGSTTANAVLAYKRKRDVVNRSYQQTADNIVGIMTMASLDREMSVLEALPSVGPRIEVVTPALRPDFRPPTPTSRNTGPLLAFKFGENLAPEKLPQIDFPRGTALDMRIVVGETATFRIVDGVGETVECDDPTMAALFDPKEPDAVGAVFVTDNPHTCRIRGLQIGLTTVRVTKSNTVGIPFGFERLDLSVMRGGTDFVSLRGTPLKPKGIGKKINIFGAEESPGFEDFATDHHSEHTKDGRVIARPYTKNPTGPKDREGLPTNTKSPPDLKPNVVGDMCCRSSPLDDLDFKEMGRIAMSKCRITYVMAGERGVALFFDRMKRNFPGFKLIQEGKFHGISEFIGPTIWSVLVIETP